MYIFQFWLQVLIMWCLYICLCILHVFYVLCYCIWNFLTLTLCRFVFDNGFYLIWCNKSMWHNIAIRVAMKDVPYIPPNTLNNSNYFYILTKSYYNFSCYPSTFVQCCLMFSWHPLSFSWHCPPCSQHFVFCFYHLLNCF